jgi:hypothetical protein
MTLRYQKTCVVHTPLEADAINIRHCQAFDSLRHQSYHNIVQPPRSENCLHETSIGNMRNDTNEGASDCAPEVRLRTVIWKNSTSGNLSSWASIDSSSL